MKMLHRLLVSCLFVVLLSEHSHQGSRTRRQGPNIGSGESGSCRTPRNVPGVCINIKECPLHLDYLVNKRSEPGIVQYLQGATCQKQGSQIFTCCPVEKSISFESSGDCQTPRQATGACVNIRKCPVLVEMLKRHSEPGVSEYLRSSVCGYDNRDPRVCCPLGGSNAEPTTREGAVLPGLDVCGLSDGANNKVVNGVPSALGSWPWMTALGYTSANKPLQWLCGGSLISDRYVLTAAHCVTNIGRKTVSIARLGDLNLDDQVADKATPLDMPIEKAIPHENYDPKLHTVDVALIKLKDRVQFSQLIRPVCLPEATTFRSNLMGYTPFITGWGAVSYRGPSTTALQEAQVDITDVQSCANAYKGIKGATIDDRVLCALSPDGKDACQGDSGGPLVLPKIFDEKTNFFLIGVVSYGYKCAEPGYPGIYSKVSLYTDWIKRNMK